MWINVPSIRLFDYIWLNDYPPTKKRMIIPVPCKYVLPVHKRRLQRRIPSPRNTPTFAYSTRKKIPCILYPSWSHAYMAWLSDMCAWLGSRSCARTESGLDLSGSTKHDWVKDVSDLFMRHVAIIRATYAWHSEYGMHAIFSLNTGRCV
jgi:hypothetical protein